MPSTSPPAHPFHVVIAGGGVAALEAGLALREFGSERFRITLIAPEPDFIYRPMTVREPFAFGPAERYPIGEFAAEIGAELAVDRFEWVDPAGQVAHTASGGELAYDALILALGARPRERYTQALNVDDRHLDDVLHGLIQDVEGGYVHRLAFVVPPRMGWPLPIYELALMTARRAFDMNVELAVTIVTPETAPLVIFGEGASATATRLLADAGITIISSSTCEVPNGRSVTIEPSGQLLDVDRVVALPELYGPCVRGLPVGEHGFVPIDEHCRVPGLERVYAAGDATAFPIKYGGIAAQHADAAAEMIAAVAGLPVEPTPLHLSIQGILLTGAEPLFLSARIIAGRGFSAANIDMPAQARPAKITARYLGPYLEEHGRVAGAAR
jgi:sulfide:quinone oxidoreductase